MFLASSNRCNCSRCFPFIFTNIRCKL